MFIIKKNAQEEFSQREQKVSIELSVTLCLQFRSDPLVNL